MPSPFENLCGPGKPLRPEPPDAALRWHGYRSSNRYIVFQLLPHTLGLGPEVWRVLDKCHHLRNLGEYEGSLAIDERIVTDLLAACRAVAAKVQALPPPAA